MMKSEGWIWAVQLRGEQQNDFFVRLALASKFHVLSSSPCWSDKMGVANVQGMAGSRMPYLTGLKIPICKIVALVAGFVRVQPHWHTKCFG